MNEQPPTEFDEIVCVPQGKIDSQGYQLILGRYALD